MVLCEREYRRGNPIVNDAVYDFKLLPELKKRDPNHPLLSHIGADDFSTTLDTSLMYGVIYPSGSICETKVTRDVALSEKATHGGQIIKFVGDNACIVDLDDMITDHNLNLIKERKK